MTEKERSSIKVELKSRKIVEKKLETAIRALEKPIARIKAEREKRKEELSEYRDERDLLDAYGWGIITEEEYDDLRDRMAAGKDLIDNEKSEYEIAQEMMRSWLRDIRSDIESLKFDLLPAEKQVEILENNYRIAKQRIERQKARAQSK